MQIVNRDIKEAKKYVKATSNSIGFMKRNAHHKVRAAVRSALDRNDWETAETPTAGVRPLSFWDIA